MSNKVRKVTSEVSIFTDTVLTPVDFSQYVKSIEISRVGDTSKFFGFGISQKINVKLVGVSDDTLIASGNHILIGFNVEQPKGTTPVNYADYPIFTITEVNYKETEKEYSITAYDLIKEAEKHTTGEVLENVTVPYSVADAVDTIADLIGAASAIYTEPIFDDLVYEEGFNMDGTYNIRSLMTAIAEATQTIYYIDEGNNLVFERLDYFGNPVKTITRNDYFKLDTKTNRRLQTVAEVTDLGENYSASTSLVGTTQFVVNNPLWDLREDIETLVEDALDVVGNAVMSQYEMEWRGDLGLNVGQKFSVTNADGTVATSYILDDVITYDGGLKQKTKWEYEDNDEETFTNSTDLGVLAKRTYAKVDKVNKNVEIMAADVTDTKVAVSSLQITTDGMTAAVENMSQVVSDAINNTNEEIQTLTSRVNAQLTAEDVQLQIQSSLSSEVSTVTTTTGFTFDENGLTISKTGSEMETSVDEDGMTISRSGTEVLVADNEGVTAYNLHANTYLIIGQNSRFEDYDNNSRTGCFWIGG